MFEVCVVLYGMGTYFDHKVILGVVKEGDNFNIDTITKPQEDVASTTANEAEANNSYFMSGHVSDYPVTMYIEINGTQVKGYYYYDRQYEKKGKAAELNLSGTNDSGQLDLNETNSDGTPTGHFRGRLRDGIFKGQFINTKGEQMPFSVSQ